MAENGTDCDNTETVEREHTKRLRSALNSVIEKCISSTKLSHFAHAYSGVQKTEKQAVAYVHEKFQGMLRTSMQTEIETLFEEENIVDVLNELDQLIESAPLDQASWRPSGVPSEDVRPHLVAVKLCQKQKLEKLLAECEGRQHQLESAVKQRQRSLMELQQRLSQKMHSLHEALIQCEETVDLIQSSGLTANTDLTESSGKTILDIPDRNEATS